MHGRRGRLLGDHVSVSYGVVHSIIVHETYVVITATAVVVNAAAALIIAV